MKKRVKLLVTSQILFSSMIFPLISQASELDGVGHNGEMKSTIVEPFGDESEAETNQIGDANAFEIDAESVLLEEFEEDSEMSSADGWNIDEAQNSLDEFNFRSSRADGDLSGISGTSPWTYERATGTLRILGGELNLPVMKYYESAFIDLLSSNGSRGPISKIIFEGPTTIKGSADYLFANIRNLEVIENLNLLDTSQVTSMKGMFMSNFYRSLITSVDLSNFDTSNVTDMSFMFRANALDNIDLSSFDTSNVTDMSNMFALYSGSKLDLSSLDTSNVITMAMMFNRTENLTELNFPLDFSNVTDMSRMFSGSGITELDLSNFTTTSNVINMSYMFAGTSNLTELNVSNFDTSKVTNMSSMFEGSPVATLDVSNFDAHNVREMQSMFAGMENIVELDLSSFDSTLSSGESMFENAVNLERVNISALNMKSNEAPSMFTNTPKLRVLTLGKGFVGGSNLTGLANGGFNGFWRSVGNGSIEFPKGKYVDTGFGLMQNYDGVYMADTYVWEPEVQDIKVTAKDSTIVAESTWKAEDNFVSATDEYGQPVAFKDVQVSGTVDTKIPGNYEVTYTYGSVSATATITVIDKTLPEVPVEVKAKDSTIVVGATWKTEDNFVSATDKYGKPVDFKDVQVSGTVDTKVPGKYKITYTYDGVSTTITVTVSDKVLPEVLVKIEAKDSTIVVGSTWKAEDNFISATDKYGKPVDFKDVLVSGSVDSQTPGKYHITYRYDGVSKTITVTVTNKAKPITDGNTKPTSSLGNSNSFSGSNAVNNKPSASSATKRLPQTGEKIKNYTLLSMALIGLSAGLYFFRKKKITKF